MPLFSDDCNFSTIFRDNFVPPDGRFSIFFQIKSQRMNNNNTIEIDEEENEDIWKSFDVVKTVGVYTNTFNISCNLCNCWSGVYHHKKSAPPKCKAQRHFDCCPARKKQTTMDKFLVPNLDTAKSDAYIKEISEFIYSGTPFSKVENEHFKASQVFIYNIN